MAIYKGNKKIVKIYKGTKEIKRIYKGDKLVFGAAPSPDR